MQFVLNNVDRSPAGVVTPRGELIVTKLDSTGQPVVPMKSPSAEWFRSNAEIQSHKLGELGYQLMQKYGVQRLRKMGLLVVMSELRLIHIANNGEKTDYGVVSRQVVTDAGVAAIVDAFTNTFELETFNYHGAGTGTTAENASQTALITESTTALNPDNTRATGTQSQPSANIYRSVGTLTFDGSAAITEHGLFSDVDVTEGTMLDRSVFSAVNVVSGESIQFQYSLTFPAGS